MLNQNTNLIYALIGNIKHEGQGGEAADMRKLIIIEEARLTMADNLIGDRESCKQRSSRIICGFIFLLL